MRGYFDEEDREAERPGRDREVTLGAGAVLGLVFGLFVLCGLCFGAGYAVGHHASARTAAANAPIPAPDQEPLQPNSSIPKPSAAETSTEPAAQPGDSATTPQAGMPAGSANPATTQSPAASQQGGSGQGAGRPGAPSSGAAQPVRPALPVATNTQSPAQAAPNVRPALPAQGQLMVQIAAVANVEDADVLVTALRRHGYSVTSARDSGDGLIHVRIGPFASRDEANRWRNKLLGDGYNAVVQP